MGRVSNRWSAARSNVRKSITYFQRAIERDSDSALGYCGLADSYLRLLDKHHLPPKDATALAKEAAERALALDETLAEVHPSLGHIQLHELDCRAAEERFRRAIELNPSYATAYFYFANCLLALGRGEEGPRCGSQEPGAGSGLARGRDQRGDDALLRG